MSGFEILRILVSRSMDPFVILLLSILLISLWSVVRSKFKQPKMNFIAVCSLLLYIFSLPFIANFIIEKWEQDVSKFSKPKTAVDYIVVLGCGHTNDSRLPLSNHLSTCSIRRLTEGIFIQKELPNVPMVFTGGKGGDEESHAMTMHRVARAFGVAEHLMLVSEEGNNTFEEGEALKELLLNKNVVLVTSASHMNRATLVFSNLGTRKIFPAPTNFYVIGQEPHFILTLIPSINHLNIVAKFTHETFGRFYTNLINAF
jgi:uncharacterized SAM-binding protein YcdF (DUF218 family)